ncbi:MAG TPA: NBR1-Ig-like domain-containing protein, partial [Anaerolineales bacterium]
MSSRNKLSSILLLCAMLLSLIPAATLVQPAFASSTCDWAQFIADVTVPDGTNYAGGTAFQKTWRLKNIGTCTWTTGYSLVFDSGDRFGAADATIPISVAPGQTVDLTLNMTAPAAAGHYFSYWRLKNASGVIFGIGSTANRSFWAEINVTTGTGTGVAYDFTTNVAAATWTNGTNGSGYADVLDAPKFESGVTFPAHGMRFVPGNVTNTYVQAVYPPFRVQSGDRFQATVGCEFNATACYVQYRLDYQIGSGPVRTFWTFREKYEGLTYPANLNLSSLAGSDVKFILVVSAFGSPVGDIALWGNPIIARAGAVTP